MFIVRARWGRCRGRAVVGVEKIENESFHCVTCKLDSELDEELK